MEERTEAATTETIESDEETPLEPEDLARKLFASYLEPPAEEKTSDAGERDDLDDSGESDPDLEDAGEIDLATILEASGEASDTDEPPGEEETEAGRNWYVIHSYSGYENKVRKNLEHRIESLGMQDKIFEVVVPTEEEIELKDGQRRTVERRIFPGYILVDMLMDEDSWYVVRNTPGVTPKVKVSFQIGQKVRIADGPFEDFVGGVDEIYADKGKVRILVSFFGRETPVELDFLQVEKI
jgi:transcriptional antiterminator NusG